MIGIKTKKEELDEILSQIEEKVFEEKDSILLATSHLGKMPVIKSFEYISNFIKDNQYTIDAIKGEISKVIDLDKYYKSSNGKKSIKIVFDNDIKNAINASNNSIIKNRLVSSNYIIKSSYLKDKHTNFFELDIDSDQSIINSVRREDAEEAILVAILRGKRFTNEFGKNTVNSFELTPLQRNLDILYTRVASLKRDNYSLFNSELDKLTSIARHRRYSSYERNRMGLGEEETIRTLRSLRPSVSSSKSKAISSILDIYDVQKSKLDSISKIEKVNSVNPVSGFVSVKAVRVPKSEDISKEEVDKLANDFSDTNLFFETFSNEIQKILIAKQAKNKREVKEIFGDDIKRLYHISSYFSFKISSEGIVKKSDKHESGTLGNSCMRNADAISRIDFYSKNSHFVSMLAITDVSTKKLHARAIVWTDPKTKIKYVDRIYSHNAKDYNSMVAHICSTDNMYSIYQSQSNSFPDKKSIRYFSVNVDKINGVYRLPYLDSVRLVRNQGKISIGRFEIDLDSISTTQNIDLTKETITINKEIATCHGCGCQHSSLLRHPERNNRLFCPGCIYLDIFREPFIIDYSMSREGRVLYFNGNTYIGLASSRLRFCSGIISMNNTKNIMIGCGVYNEEYVGVPFFDKNTTKVDLNLSLIKTYLKIKHNVHIPDRMILGRELRVNSTDMQHIAYDKRYFKTITIENYSIIVEKDDSEICKKSLRNVELLIKAINLSANDFCDTVKDNIGLINLLNRKVNQYYASQYIIKTTRNIFSMNSNIYDAITPSYISGKTDFNGIFIKTSHLFELERSVFIPLEIFDETKPKTVKKISDKVNKITSKAINKFGIKK